MARRLGVILTTLAFLCAGCGPPPQGLDRRGVKAEPGPVDPGAPQEFTTTESGLKYRIRRAATGPKPSQRDSVQVQYKGWLDDGQVFDQSYGRRPAEFKVTGVVPGFSEGLMLLNTGGMIELEIPSELGYGVRGMGSTIPPNATLHFLIELEEVFPAP